MKTKGMFENVPIMHNLYRKILQQKICPKGTHTGIRFPFVEFYYYGLEIDIFNISYTLIFLLVHIYNYFVAC